MLFNITEDMVRSRFSNVQSVVMGEPSLLERIAPVIEQWDSLLIERFLPQRMAALPDFEPLCIDVVIYGALFDALPMLDVVLTPNGLATVGNTNLVPASAARSEAARSSLGNLLFRAQDALLAALRRNQDWRETSYAFQFLQSLFCSLSDLCRLDPENLPKSFERAMILQSKAAHLENKFARCYISHQLMTKLRISNLADKLSFEERHVISRIKNAVAQNIRSDGARGDALIDIVDYIKRRPDAFPLWHSSSLANVFSDNSFQNDPKAGGYFF